jgi:hypothetical protein
MPDDVISIHNDDSVADAETDQTTATACLISNVDVALAKFPSSFYAIDVHTTFTFKTIGKLTVEAQYVRFLDLPWKSLTYYYHKAWWCDALCDAKDNAVTAGYSDAGCYSMILEAHP